MFMEPAQGRLAARPTHGSSADVCMQLVLGGVLTSLLLVAVLFSWGDGFSRGPVSLLQRLDSFPAKIVPQYRNYQSNVDGQWTRPTSNAGEHSPYIHEGNTERSTGKWGPGEHSHNAGEWVDKTVNNPGATGSNPASGSGAPLQEPRAQGMPGVTSGPGGTGATNNGVQVVFSSESIDVSNLEAWIKDVITSGRPESSYHGLWRTDQKHRQPKITGSKLRGGADVEQFRSRWDCLASAEPFHWRLDATPRIVPWASPDLIMGRFQPMTAKTFDGRKVNKAFIRGVFKRHANDWNAAVPDNLKYVWDFRTERKKDACSMPPPPPFNEIDIEGFCSALRRKSGSFWVVGDSITTLFLAGMVAEFSARGYPIREMEPTRTCKDFREEVLKRDHRFRNNLRFRQCTRWMICGETEETGGVVMHNAVSCHLQFVHRLAPKASYGLSDWCFAFDNYFWGEEMVRHRASVVLLNRGAHFAPDEQFVPQLRYTLHELRRLLPDALVAYRSTMPGHPHCQNYDKPAEEAPRENYTMYNWERVGAQNVLARRAVEEIDGVFVDVAPMTSLRPDFHYSKDDCLHYKIPGPPNGWSRFFTSLLQELL